MGRQTSGVLVIDNRAKYARKPDYWMLSTEKFSIDELERFKTITKRLRLSILPDGQPARWSKLYSKDRILGTLESLQRRSGTK